MPQTYQQEELGNQAIVYLHYFHGGADWYVTERDMDGPQHQAFGLADLIGRDVPLEVKPEGELDLGLPKIPKSTAAISTSTASINIDMDKPCAECRKAA